MGVSNSIEEKTNYEGKIFGPNGNLMAVSNLLRIQEQLQNRSPTLSHITEAEKRALMPKLRKVYELIDNWRSDVDLQYRQIKAMAKIAEENAEVPVQVLGALVSLLCVLPGLPAAAGAVQITNLLKTSTMMQNDAGAFAGKAFEVVKYVYTIGSQLTDSCKGTMTFEEFLLKASENLRALLCNPTEEQWKSLRVLSSLEIDTNLYLYEEIRNAMVKHTRPLVYEYVYWKKLQPIKEKIARNDISFIEMGICDGDIPFIIQRAVREKKYASLILQKNKITEEGVRLLCEELRTNTTLEWLELSWNKGIGDGGAEHFANLLSNNPALTKLGLSNTGLTDKGVRLLGDSLRTNTSLTLLHLSFNDAITYPCIDRITSMFNHKNAPYPRVMF